MDAIKGKYRDLAMKYHPDRVAHLGEEFRALADEKFRAIRQAYETIEKLRAG
jgi:DnaJ like chaperone protein